MNQAACGDEERAACIEGSQIDHPSIVHPSRSAEYDTVQLGADLVSECPQGSTRSKGYKGYAFGFQIASTRPISASKVAI